MENTLIDLIKTVLLLELNNNEELETNIDNIYVENDFIEDEDIENEDISNNSFNDIDENDFQIYYVKTLGRDHGLINK